MNIILLAILLAAIGVYAVTRAGWAAPALPPPAPEPEPPAPSVSAAEIVAETKLRDTKQASAGLAQTYEKIRKAPAVTPPEPVARKDYNERLTKAKAAMEAANTESAKLNVQLNGQGRVVSDIAARMAGASGAEYSRLLADYQTARAKQLELLGQYETSRQVAIQAGITYSEIRAGV